MSYEKINLTMLTDFYELTMAGGYFEENMQDIIATFDMFYRKNPDQGGFAIMAGLEQVICYLQNLKFTEEDIAFLRNKKIFSEKFLEYLKDFEFACDVWAVEEGTPIFPNEPIITVRGPIIQAQLVETMILLTINHQSLIATKASRIVRAANGRGVMEFGSRRAHSYDAAVYGARAAYIGGCIGTACTISDRDMAVPALGTMAHSWIQSFDSEYEAFCAYARRYPHSCTLLVDTYNVIKSGIPNAIRAFNDVLLPMGCRPKGIRIDSGDITYLSKKVRKMLDEAGYPDCQICASNSLDEYIISDMLRQGAQVDSFGVGEKLITASSEAVFGGVYKVVSIYKNGQELSKIKVSENTGKITNPCRKELYRLYDRESGKALADVLTLFDEKIDDTQEYMIFDPNHTWKKKKLSHFKAVKLRKQIFKNGKLCYDLPSLEEIRIRCSQQLETLWEEVKRFENPHTYYVDLSQNLWNEKQRLLTEAAEKQNH